MEEGSALMLAKACTNVFCQFTASPADAASVAITSRTGTRRYNNSASRQISSAKSRLVKELISHMTIATLVSISYVFLC